MRRTAAKIDGNQRAIVKALRQMGCSVLSMAALGKGIPDLLVARCGRLALVEIKNGDAVPSRQVLTEDQIRFHATWNSEIKIIHSVDEAIWFVENCL